ncbi:hypothetical protein F2P56_010821 [Juglans regia]|uniref:Calcium uniporter protein C-terminal domain-containing protein n=2 Tax=Juglans regia TaxID=51240 RepID=A0A833XS71_JUGRE|nr:calcium uniporter protein 6, mitochondrial-like [Juglans regia]KAF5470299.1 hypothetical protein F2P56_010821 [Juglans regia]
MWRRWWSGGAVKQSVSVVFGQFNGRKIKPPNPSQILGLRAIVPASSLWLRTSSTSPPPPPPLLCVDSNTGGSSVISFEEAKKVMRLVNVEELKRKLGTEGKEVISYSELLDACKSMGVARSLEEAAAFARVLDEAGVILLFRHKVYLHPDKMVDLVRRAVPLALTSEDDPMRDELKRLQEKKEEIDVLAHKQVRRILWTGLGIAVVQVGLFFRLTFWEYSWDVMEPIAFFSTTTGIVIGYAYFLFTSRDPSYQDLMKRLFLARQRKLIKKRDFNCQRYKELENKCKTSLHATASIKNRVGLELELDDALHRD